jgi:L-alanine-DL-glutamate epimerase-like enolase superfamily enzyme
MVLVELQASDGSRGLGYTYGSAAAAQLIHELLTDEVMNRPVDKVRAAWEAMIRAVRNVGRPGIAATAISAVDIALWDLKAKTYGRPLAQVLGQRRREVPVYGSGGFTSYSIAELQSQLADWAEQGFPRVKMKIGKDWGNRAEEDIERVAAARAAIGPTVELFVDANGAYTTKQAIALADRMQGLDVSYFEEPVSSDHLEQLARVRRRASMAIAAGEYAYDPWYVRDMLEAGAVDVQQADVTRCLGITGWLAAADVAYAFDVPFSGHCAPSVHAAAACAVPAIAHLEFFHDHARLEEMFFDGFLHPVDGFLRPNPTRPGLGLDLKRRDAERYRH